VFKVACMMINRVKPRVADAIGRMKRSARSNFRPAACFMSGPSVTRLVEGPIQETLRSNQVELDEVPQGASLSDQKIGIE
jgi:hypothetical protein